MVLVTTAPEGSTRLHTPRQVLMVACAFPPIGGSGVQRSAKFAKYLPRSGWQPTVWAADRMEGLESDPTMLAELPPEVTVCRTRHDGVPQSFRRAARVLARHRSTLTALGQAAEWRLRRWTSQHAMPDESIRWARSSIRPLVHLIGERSIDVIYSTLTPVSNHVLGLELKRRTGRPWVADFRDLWTDDYRYCERSPQRRAAHARLQQQVLETADAVIGVSRAQTEILASHVPGCAHKFTTITNGFDPDDFSDESGCTRERRDQFVLTYVGRFDRWRVDQPWWDGLTRFTARLKPVGSRFVLRMVGHVSGPVRQKARAAGVEAEFINAVPHRKAVLEMRCADALLLAQPVGPNAESVISAKLFEYLAAGRPILLVGPEEGACEDIVRRCRAGLTVGPDAEAITAALETLYSRWEQGTPVDGCAAHHLTPFSRAALTGRLASVFDRLIGEPEPSEHVAAYRDAERRSAVPVEVSG
jgi:glycosyltransferase involved in cell wall biosynthesis